MEANFYTNARNCSTGYKESIVFLVNNPKISLSECVGNIMMQDSIVLFGGIYSRQYKNPVTNQKSCPETFTAHSLFDCNENTICLSSDYDTSVYFSVPFGGFQYVCNDGVPQCPPRYRAFPITTINNCDLYFCSILKETEMPGLIRPPYVNSRRSPRADAVLSYLKSLNKDKVLPPS